ncbi:MAG: hypothetical protein ABSE49_18290 [Polyangiaceae bacterium]
MGLQSFKQGVLAFAESPPAALVKLGRAAAVVAVPFMILWVVSPLLIHLWTLGQHNWDQMNTQREVVVQTIARYGQFPFWDPFTCGGHPGWGSLESAPIVVSPWLPVYLLTPLPIAIRIEIIVSAIVGALGAWKLSSRFTQSRAVQSIFTVVTVVNSRWAMQIGAGHTWHLLFALLPWILFLFDRAIDARTSRRDAVRDVIVAGACLALMVYGDGIYPVPHTAFAVAVFGVFMAKSSRRLRPLYAVAGFGAVAGGLSAPKLLPLLVSLQRFPRIIKSDEAIWPQYIPAIFTRRVGDYAAVGDFVSGAMWHEWGLYLGWPALIGLIAAIVASRGPREHALKWAGLIMFSFVALAGPHPITPWRILHLLPLFKSQHVPGRWLYTSVTVLACCAASGLDRWLKRAGARRPGLEALLGFAALALAIDMGSVAREPIAESFVNPVPVAPATVGAFHMVHRLPPEADYAAGLWDVSTLPAVLRNEGTLDCDTDNGIHYLHRDPEGRMPGVGAYADNDPDYRGEAYVVERAPAAATVTSFSPNEVRVRLDGVAAGDHVVLNQNWDPGWSADGAPAINWHDAVATVVTGPAQGVVFRYQPPRFWLGVAICALTLLAIAVTLRATRGGACADASVGASVGAGVCEDASERS